MQLESLSFGSNLTSPLLQEFRKRKIKMNYEYEIPLPLEVKTDLKW